MLAGKGQKQQQSPENRRPGTQRWRSDKTWKLLRTTQGAHFLVYDPVEPVKRFEIILAERVHEKGKHCILMTGDSQHHAHQLLCHAFPIVFFADGRRIEESSALLAPAQKVFLVKTVQRCHHSGVGKTRREVSVQIADAYFTARPYTMHHFRFQLTKPLKRRDTHLGLSSTPHRSPMWSWRPTFAPETPR